MPEKYRALRIEDERFGVERLGNVLNEQAEEGYIPLLFSSYMVPRSTEYPTPFEVHMIVFEYSPEQAPKEDSKKKATGAITGSMADMVRGVNFKKPNP